MPKILLVNTSYPTEFKMYFEFCTPYGLLAIAGALMAAGYEVLLVDPQIGDDPRVKIQEIIDDEVLFVGMTTFMGPNISNAVDLTRYIKEISPQTPVVWGGPLATSAPELCFKNAPVDYIVMGMGEDTVLKIASALQDPGGVDHLDHVSSNIGNVLKIKDLFFFHGDLDDLGIVPLNLWEKGIHKLGHIPILSSRGCPRNCAFCYNNTFTGRKKWYPRSAERVLDEMAHWADYFGMTVFHFIDDNFLVDTKRAEVILTEAMKRDYTITHLLGNLYDFKPRILDLIFNYIHHVGFSIESASPKIQKLLNKIVDLDRAIDLIRHLSNNGVRKINTNFMFGLPTETDLDIAENIRVASVIRDINKAVRIVPYIYTPQPGDDIIPVFPEYQRRIDFTIEALSTIDYAPNRSRYLSHAIRPWMSPDDIQFYLDLVLVWFYHFDHVVRNAQDIDVEEIYRRNKRIEKHFKNVPPPE